MEPSRGQWLSSSIAARNGRGFVDLAQPRSVAIDRQSVNAEPLGQTLGTGLGHRLVAQGAQGLGKALELALALARNTLKGACGATAHWK